MLFVIGCHSCSYLFHIFNNKPTHQQHFFLCLQDVVMIGIFMFSYCFHMFSYVFHTYHVLFQIAVYIAAGIWAPMVPTWRPTAHPNSQHISLANTLRLRQRDGASSFLRDVGTFRWQHLHGECTANTLNLECCDNMCVDLLFRVTRVMIVTAVFDTLSALHHKSKCKLYESLVAFFACCLAWQLTVWWLCGAKGSENAMCITRSQSIPMLMPSRCLCNDRTDAAQSRNTFDACVGIEQLLDTQRCCSIQKHLRCM